MTKAPIEQGLAGFYRERFNADPYALVDYCHDEIASIAAEVSLKWSSVDGRVRFNGQRLKKYAPSVKVESISSEYRGKLMVWGDLRHANSRGDLEAFDYPTLTFSNNVTGASTWSGLAALLELYKREGGQVSSVAQERWKAQQEAKRAAREAKALEDERKAREAEALVHAERLAYERAWHTGERVEFQRMNKRGQLETVAVEGLGAEDGSAPYLVSKQIGAIVSRCKLMRMRDCHGEFTGVPLYDLDGNWRGVQRLYADKKLQGTGVDMSGAHIVIGDLETAKTRYAVEGFATGASVFLAEELAGNADSVAVVVTFNVDNLGKVLRAYANRYPAWRFHNAADDDQWKAAGNAGRLAALEIHRELKHPGIMPSFDAQGAEAIAKYKAEGKGPTDWNDFHTLYGLKATAQALRARSSVLRAEKDWFEYNLQRLACSGRVHGERQALQAVTAGMMLAPIKHSGAQVLKAVLEVLPSSLDGAVRFKVRRRAQWLAKQKLAEAQQLRGFSPEALARPNVQHLRIEGVRAEHGGIVLPPHLADLVESLEGLIIVRAPMGAGKTEKLIAPLMKASSRAAYIAHRISLLDDAAARLEVDHYKQLFAWQIPHVDRLACCVNSLTKPMFYNADERSWFTTLETICIDEASQVLRHMATGPVDGRVRVTDALIDAVSSAKRVLLCDADANDSVLDFCELARPGQPVTVLEVDGSAEHIRIDHADDEVVWQLAVEAIKKGRRTLVANDSAESAKKLAASIEAHAAEGLCAMPRMLLVHADSKADAQVEAFLADPNGQAPNYDVLIYSPAISSGVSMTTPHFECHFGLFSGNTVSPSDAIQMLRRDRTARHYVVGIGHTTAQRETDRERIWRGLVKSDELAFELEEGDEHIVLRRRKTAFDQLYLSAVTSENKARNNFANNLLLMLYADGYKVNRLETEALGYQAEELIDASRKNRKVAGAMVFEKRMQLIESVATPDEEQFLKLSRQEIRSEAEGAQIDRYHIEHQLGAETITADDVDFYDNRGIAKVVALELLQATQEQAQAYDRAQAKARVTLTLHRWKTPAHALLCRIFEILGVDRHTGAGEFSAEQCRRVVALLTSSDDQVELYNALKLGRYIPSTSAKLCATTVVKSIFERLGLSLTKRKTNGVNLYAVNDDNWSFVMAYVEQRAARNIHSLTTHDHEATHSPKLAPEALETPAKAPAGLASQERDTLQGEGTAHNENYPLSTRERIYAVASRLAPPAGISLTRIVEALSPEIALSLAEPGAERSITLTHALAFAGKLLRSRSCGTV